MRIYWTSGSIPELADLPRAERRRLWRSVVGRSFRHWQAWAGFLVMATSVMSGCLLPKVIHNFPLALVVAGLMGGFAGLIYSQSLIFVLRPYLREARRSAATPSSERTTTARSGAVDG